MQTSQLLTRASLGTAPAAVRSTIRQSIGMLLVIALGNCAFAGELGLAPIAVVEPAEAIRYAWISGLCATLALVFSFLWVATGQKAFG